MLKFKRPWKDETRNIDLQSKTLLGGIGEGRSDNLPRLFLSYARGDDERFVRGLYEDLKARGFRVWFDRESLPSRQLTFHQEIADAIRKETDRVIYVAGPRAAASDYVQQELRYALELDRPVVPIQRLGTIEDVLPAELCLLQCDDFRDHGEYARQFEKLVANLRRPAPPLGALHGVPRLPPRFVARPELLKRARSALQVNLHRPGQLGGTAGVGVVGVHGMGGIGKSVLAAAIARDREVRRTYQDGIFWVSFGQQPSLLARQADLVKLLGGTDTITSVQQGKVVLGKLLTERAVVLVLDDVWDVQDTGAFAEVGPRGRLLITTRDSAILDVLAGERILVELLTEPEAMRLLVETASGVGRDLLPAAAQPPEAREVVRQSGHLPLAIALSGGMARAGASWAEILERFKQAALEEIGQRQMRDEDNPHHRTLWNAMFASVNHLGDPAKHRRFAELAVLATDRRAPEAAVATLWGYTGGLSTHATGTLLREFAERSLIHLEQHRTQPGAETVRYVYLHDLLHDCATRLAGDIVALHLAMLDAYRVRCRDGWVSGPNDGYFFQQLVRHLVIAGRREEAQHLLLSYQWIAAKQDAEQIAAVIEDYDELSPDRLEPLGLVRDALQLSAYVLESRPEELACQLVGRLAVGEHPDLRALVAAARANVRRPALLPISTTLTKPGGALLRTLRADNVRITTVVISPDGKTCASGSGDGTVRIWDLELGMCVRSIREHRRAIKGLDFTGDGGEIVVASGDGSIRIHDVGSGSCLRRESLVGFLKGHWLPPEELVFGRNGTLCASSSIWSTKVWDLRSGELIRSKGRFFSQGQAVALSESGNVYAFSFGQYGSWLKIWDVNSGKLLHTLECDSHTANDVAAIAFTPDGGTCVSAWNNGEIKAWDVASGTLLCSLKHHQSGFDRVSALAISPDRKTCVSASSALRPATMATLKVWDLLSGRCIMSVGGSGFVAAAIDPRRKLCVSGTIDGRLQFWDLDSRKRHLTAEQHLGTVTSLTISEHSRVCVSGSCDKVIIWDLQSGKPHRVLNRVERRRDEILALAIRPGARTCVGISRGRASNGLVLGLVEIWDLDSGRLISFAEVPYPSAAALSPDGKSCILGCEEMLSFSGEDLLLRMIFLITK